MIERIENITLYVKDQEEAKRFWIEKIGFEVKLEHSLGPNMKYIEVGPIGTDTTSFALYDKKQMSNKNPILNVSHPTLLFKAKDIEKTYNDFKDNGVKVGAFMEMELGKMFSFKDIDGNSYIVREEN
ncbi:VOC family protein [Clostridium paraputrificum]|uniref:VOC family protein n=1 Tax=Clostridium TaxID=1485 RepID=UPI003D32ACF9